LVLSSGKVFIRFIAYVPSYGSIGIVFLISFCAFWCTHVRIWVFSGDWAGLFYWLCFTVFRVSFVSSSTSFQYVSWLHFCFWVSLLHVSEIPPSTKKHWMSSFSLLSFPNFIFMVLSFSIFTGCRNFIRNFRTALSSDGDHCR
jgi:hypothetical protein